MSTPISPSAFLDDVRRVAEAMETARHERSFADMLVQLDELQRIAQEAKEAVHMLLTERFPVEQRVAIQREYLAKAKRRAAELATTSGSSSN